jgi:hypothetical protein
MLGDPEALVCEGDACLISGLADSAAEAPST